MKKINIEKHKKFLKELEPKLFEAIVCLVSFVLTALAIDLKLETMAKVCSSIFLAFFFYCVIWACHVLFIACVKKRREKQNKNADVQLTVEASNPQRLRNDEEAQKPREASLEEVNKENEN